MNDTSFQYALEYTNEAGETIGSIPFDPDWLPAREYGSWEAMRQGLVPSLGGPEALKIAPVWDDEAGIPVMSAVRIEGSPGVAIELEAHPYFRSAARERSGELVDRGWIEAGASYFFRVCAYARGRDAAREKVSNPTGAVFEVEEATTPLGIDERSIDTYIRASRAVGPEPENEMPVFIQKQVMVEASALSRAAGKVETGGILVGNVRRSTETSEIFLEVTAMIPALHTMAESQRLTFTPDTWAAAKNAVELRKNDEIQVGWFHFHPRFCANCPAEAQKVCAWGRSFFSSEDIHMQRTIFPRAFQIALLFSDLGGAELDASLYGWSRGVVANRGFQILDSKPEPNNSNDSNEEVESK